MKLSIKREFRPLLRLALPLAPVHVGSQMMGLVDTAVVRRPGAVPLGAGGLATALCLPLFVFWVGRLLGLDPTTVQACGP